MKFRSLFFIPIFLGVIVYFAVKKLNLEPSSSNLLISILASALLMALLYISQSGRSEGSLKAQIDSLKEEKSKVISEFNQKVDKITSDSERTISNLKQENEKLIKENLKYTHRQTILSKYTHNQNWGYWTHNETKKNYCNKCLIDNDPPKEAPLTDRKDCWHCEICNTYYYAPHDNGY